MATYVYRCPECRIEAEKKHPMIEDPMFLCEACGTELRRRPQVAGISLRGKGFYKNDKDTEGL